MKVQIENAVLRGMNQDWVPQRVASVFSDGKEYLIQVPARAKGDALDWVEQFEVRELSESRQGHNPVDERCAVSIVKEVKEQLETNKLSSEIWSSGHNDASYYAGQICQKGHVQSSDGKHEVRKGEHCRQCGNPIIDACPHCEAPIRGQDILVAPRVCTAIILPQMWPPLSMDGG
jgi:hypothetical protein